MQALYFLLEISSCKIESYELHVKHLSSNIQNINLLCLELQKKSVGLFIGSIISKYNEELTQHVTRICDDITEDRGTPPKDAIYNSYIFADATLKEMISFLQDLINKSPV